MKGNLNFLKTKRNSIVNQQGEKIILRGLNLGGWLLMEGYILGGRNIPEREFKREFANRFGKEELERFNHLYRDNFITELDFKYIARCDFNCVRVPFNYRILEDDVKPFKYKKEGISYLDKVIELCNKYKIYCILDLHAVQGAQNKDWHSDSSGKALLWSENKYQKRCLRLWEFLADRYKDKAYLAGYDILNEPVNDNPTLILSLYQCIIKTIRSVDKNHIIFLEGNMWAQQLDFLRGNIYDDNFVYSIHFYAPLEFSFGFCQGLIYPGRIGKIYWSKSTLKNILLKYYKIKKEDRIPIYVGEFGQNSRCPYCHKEFQWLRDTLELFKEFGFHWTYWTYKTVASALYPDGLYQYLDNPSWINRQGPISGWENYYYLWNKIKKDILNSWQTKNFVENKNLLDMLTSFIK